MTTFFITPFAPLEWESSECGLSIEPDWYANKLQERWRGIELFPSSSQNVLLMWLLFEVSTKMIPLGIGTLNVDKQTISMDTPVPEFFAWHRSVIPTQYRLYLFNESSLENFLLMDKGITLEEINKFIG
jgi:hypothetical protein